MTYSASVCTREQNYLPLLKAKNNDMAFCVVENKLISAAWFERQQES